MSNGSNSWNVQFSRIEWLDGVLRGHKNCVSVLRRDDIVFEVERMSGRKLIILCLDEYVFGLSAAQRALAEFSDVHVIYIGGKWNKTTTEANEYCKGQGVRVIDAGGINGVLHSRQ